MCGFFCVPSIITHPSLVLGMITNLLKPQSISNFLIFQIFSIIYVYSNHLSFLFSESDVAFVIKYHFHDSVDVQNRYGPEENNKKSKVSLPAKPHSVIEYSHIKLPAPMFAHYLEYDCQSFISDCIRYTE
jgi:hypothetical protein